MDMSNKGKQILLSIAATMLPALLYAQTAAGGNGNGSYGITILLLLMVLAGLALVLVLKSKAMEIIAYNRRKYQPNPPKTEDYIRNLDSKEIEAFLQYKNQSKRNKRPRKLANTVSALLALLFLGGGDALAQTTDKPTGPLFGETGVIITVVLLLIPILAGIALMIVKLQKISKGYQNKYRLQEAKELATELENLDDEEAELILRKRKQALDYSLTHSELSGNLPAEDEKGLLLNVKNDSTLPIVATKKKAQKRPNVDPQLSKLVLWYIGCATFWLLFGTSMGEYLGIKFVAPDADHISWLSFGRLRPVHTNAVFWGWASLAMIGLGYYVVPTVSNTKVASFKKAWATLILINAAVIIGTICLMAGINNGGGEYREYVWPVMALFGTGLALTLYNYLQTIARRTTKEIYISNWYIVAAVIFTLVIATVAYVPVWQNGLGETIVQGYYMHQGVGMWFMLFTLGVVYYFLPQQLNKPIYSYSLGILAFWTQILFYTLIGTHHFVFSSIPWWLQTVAIVGSGGMAIPVIAGTTNFLMTFKGAWYKVAGSYTLPFFLVGIIFYFTGSMQGTAEAFRSTNMMWHFTDFTVAHSHLTMYGIICFFMWAGIYAVVPRITGKEPPQITVGAHFWLALIGLLFYTVPLMYGSTLKGLMWIEGKPFIEGVVFMAPYWLWRAIGGSLMWISHLFFAYNFYKMLQRNKEIDVKEKAIEILKQKTNPSFEPELQNN
jgi:cytochrome c oxidase cbb3-type subunit 1